MKYPNAANGVKKIFISEIIVSVAAAVMVICSVIGWLCLGRLAYINVLGVVIIVMIASLAMYAFAYVLQIIGISRAGKDEPAFKVSLFSIIAMLVITVALAVFYDNHVVSYILEIAWDVAQFFLVHYIIHGVMHLSEHLGRHDMVKQGKDIFRVIYLAIGFEIIVHIVEIIFGRTLGESIALPFEIVANILKLVENILFLMYVGKGNQLLREN